ncbi:hypothetical protein [Salinimonas lutimaris]|uniref:hypothetical protein n=1 Tax=Salinimonas lutimaris TaxID=914153 RepID=UPI0010C0B263|nr:hypothetical protein [Salinimonas lutimaris]
MSVSPKKGVADSAQPIDAVTKTCPLLSEPLGRALIEWHTTKHSFTGDNLPLIKTSQQALEKLLYTILIPVQRVIGQPKITYGFTTFELKKYIQKNAPKGTAPELDQHSAFEVNSKNNQICSRGGAACDFYVDEIPSSKIVCFIAQTLEYDRIYFYGDDKPIHVSIHLTDSLRHLQIMKMSQTNRRYPGAKAYGDKAIQLAETL